MLVQWNLGKAEPEVQIEYPFRSSWFLCVSWISASYSLSQESQTQLYGPIAQAAIVLDLECEA